MKRMCLAAVIAAFVAVPAFAQEKMAEEMTCAELMAMDEAGQMEAMTQMEMAAAKAEGKEMTSDEAMAAGEEMMPGTMTACEGNPDMMAMEAMKEGM